MREFDKGSEHFPFVGDHLIHSRYHSSSICSDIVRRKLMSVTFEFNGLMTSEYSW